MWGAVLAQGDAGESSQRGEGFLSTESTTDSLRRCCPPHRYRAPELLLGMTTQTTSIDMW